MKSEAGNEIAQILAAYGVTDAESLYALAGIHVALLYEDLKPIQEKHNLSSEEMETLLEQILLK